MEIAEELGISQAQISRIEKNAINNLKKHIKQLQNHLMYDTINQEGYVMIKEILNKFNIEGELINITENHSGNINKTFVATFKRKRCV